MPGCRAMRQARWDADGGERLLRCVIRRREMRQGARGAGDHRLDDQEIWVSSLMLACSLFGPSCSL